MSIAPNDIVPGLYIDMDFKSYNGYLDGERVKRILRTTTRGWRARSSSGVPRSDGRMVPSSSDPDLAACCDDRNGWMNDEPHRFRDI